MCEMCALLRLQWILKYNDLKIYNHNGHQFAIALYLFLFEFFCPYQVVVDNTRIPESVAIYIMKNNL